MIKHIVMWRIAAAEGRSKEENIQLLREKLEALPAIIPEIRGYEVGVNIADSAAAFDVVLVSDFRSVDDLQTYRVHPEHVRVAEFIGKIREQNAVVDYEY